MDYGLPGSSVRGILQARTLEWVGIPFSRGSSRPRDQEAWSFTLWTYSLPSELSGKPRRKMEAPFSGEGEGSRADQNNRGPLLPLISLVWPLPSSLGYPGRIQDQRLWIGIEPNYLIQFPQVKDKNLRPARWAGCWRLHRCLVAWQLFELLGINIWKAVSFLGQSGSQ